MSDERKLHGIKGYVKQIRYKNESTMFMVFTVSTSRRIGGKILTCVGKVLEPLALGTLVEAFGFMERNEKYGGEQLKVSSISVMCGTDAESVAKYLISIAKHLGDEKAMRIANHFGQSLEEILEKDPERLMEVDGIGRVIYQNIMDGWQAQRGVRGVKIFLLKMGMHDSMIRKVIERHGSGFEEVIKSNPYVLLNDGLAFSACERLSEKLELSPSSDERYRGLIRSIVKDEAQKSGHMFVTLRHVVSAVNTFNSDCSPKRKLDKDGIDTATIEAHLDWLGSNGFLVIDKETDAIYDVSAYYYESKAAKKIMTLMSSDRSKTFNSVNAEKFIDTYQREEAVSLGIEKFELSEQQRDAVTSFFSEKVMVVTGAPGTGKTTILKSFVKILKGGRINFKLFAPTGAAAKRLAHTAKEMASTIHRGLGAKMGGAWDFHEGHLLETDCVIVDEFSMVDTQLLCRLMLALKPTTMVVFVGDVDQLPSVGPGYVLRNLISCGSIKTIRLTKVQRQAEASAIVRLANSINSGNIDRSCIGSSLQEDEVVFLRTGRDYEAATEIVQKLAVSLAAKKQVGLFQVLTPRNKGPLSVESLNKAIQEKLNPAREGLREIELDQGLVIRKGDRVLVTKNNYNLNVFNGDMAKVRGITDTDIIITVEGPDGDGERTPIPLASAKDLIRLGYAITIHKSQGMEYRVVIMPLIRAHGSNLLQRNLVYTGITRAKKKVILIGETDALEQAVSNAEIQKRNTNLGSYINMAISGDLDPTAVLAAVPETAENYQYVRSLLFPTTEQQGISKDEWF